MRNFGATDINYAIGWGSAKQKLFEIMDAHLAPMREKYNDFMAHPEKVDKILADGATRARATARETLARVKKAIGIA